MIGRWVTIPGTASCFCLNSGTQKEWMTSSACMLSSTCRPSTSRSSSDWKPPYCGYLKCPGELLRGHVHLQAVLLQLAVLSERDGADDAITITSTVGIAVHAISIPVWPWIGGPSESSSGRARNLTTE